MKFLFFTKTNWDEPPRLRHQLAYLLSNAGHKVTFFECPAYAWVKKECAFDTGRESIQCVRASQLIHHKLRLNPVVHKLNAIWEKKEISRVLKPVVYDPETVIVNFNYDYYFVRDLFPDSKIVTVINDDFWCRAIGGWETPLRWALEKTCLSSDEVLTVSPSLQRQLSQYCSCNLFYPWADVQYTQSDPGAEKNTLLFWGYISDKLDYSYVSKLATHLKASESNYELLFVGPVMSDSAVKEALNSLIDQKLIQWRPATSLDELPLESVLAAFIPCLKDNPDSDAIYIPNKGFRVLARGLPITITGMPDFIEKPFVFRFSGEPSQDILLLDSIKSEFVGLQEGIRSFVDANNSSHRLNQFLSYCS